MHKEPLDKWQVGRVNGVFLIQFTIKMSHHNLAPPVLHVVFLQNLNGTDFLGLMISDPSRWGLAFESLVLETLTLTLILTLTLTLILTLTMTLTLALALILILTLTLTLALILTLTLPQVTLTMAEIHMADHPSQAKDGSITPTAPVKVADAALIWIIETVKLNGSLR